ncbi:cache domain-containing protein [Vibrio sp. CDRSL-10 TSBA]
MKLANRTLLQKWRYRLKTTVRYRLLILTSAPIAFTLVALIVISIYWSLHYTWQSALVDVSERLGVARNSVSLLQQRQANEVRAFAESYAFRSRVLQMNADTLKDPLSLRQWVSAQKARYSLDFLNFEPLDSDSEQLSEKRKLSQRQARYQELSARDSFFDVLSHEELAKFSPALAERAKLPAYHSDKMETRGLVSRTVVAVNDQHHNLIGFLDGGLLLNNSSALVDQLRDLIYPMRREQMRSLGTVTIFLDALRISTNVPLDSSEQQGRAVGTRVSDAVQTQVLQQGLQWVDRAYVYDAWYITAYEPIRDSNQQVIGMLYTGHLLWPFVKSYLTNIVEIAIATLSLLLVSGIFVYRGSRDLFRPIERIHRVVKLVQLGKNQRIGELGLDHDHELAQLARQFDNMLDLLQQRNEEIQRAAHELEGKVSDRTASLQDKTAELEHHIQLLNQTRDKLIVHEKLAALGELTAGIAHEINNPTAVILGNTELIKFELGDDAQRVEEEIDAILLQIDRIRNITRSLLQYSRHGGVQDEITWQHINPIIEESITLVKTGTKKRDVEFVTRFAAQSSVEVNRHQLLQILVNLQMNAIHAMNGQGKLTIRSEDWCEQGEVLGAVVHIEDQGCGIKPEHLKRVFDPFYTTKREGTGLGLSVSQSLLSQTGGEIRVKSEYGKGSTFSVYLPSKADAHLLITKVS